MVSAEIVGCTEVDDDALIGRIALAQHGICSRNSYTPSKLLDSTSRKCNQFLKRRIDMNKVFINFDARQQASFTVCAMSVIEHAKTPVAIVPVVLKALPFQWTCLTPVTYSRFLVPWMSDFEGMSIYLDADTLVRGDITELFSYCRKEMAKRDDQGLVQPAVWVNVHQPEFEWASVIVFNNGHPSNAKLTPKHVQVTPEAMHKMGWVLPHEVGEFPPEWNVRIGYEKVPDDPKLIRFTQGVPQWWETEDQPFADEWRAKRDAYVSAQDTWFHLMGQSLHAYPVVSRLIKTGRISSLEAYIDRLKAHGEAVAG